MLLSRFWYIFLAVAAGAAASAALLSMGVINRQEIEHVTDELARDRSEIDAILRLEARARLDRIAFISVDNKLGSLLKQASGTPDPKQLGHIGSEAKDALRGHIARLLEAVGSDSKKADDLKPDIAIAVDASGRIIAQLGPLESNPPGSSLATYPFIDRALHGYVRDDVIVYDRRVYRVASRPVLYGGEYVGAIAHGYKFDDALCERVSQGLGGASVMFFYGHTPLASFVASGAPSQAEVATELASTLGDEKFKRGERSDLKSLTSGGRAVYSLLVGSAAQAEVGYAVARPLTLIASPLAFFQGASSEDVHALPIPLLAISVGLLAIIGLLCVYFERDRPYRVFASKLQQIVQGERERMLVTEWRGVYRKLADLINQALDKNTERAAENAPAAKKKANLDEILGPTPESNIEPYFGFADAPSQPKAAAKPNEPPATPKPAPKAEAPAPPKPPQAPPIAAPKPALANKPLAAPKPVAPSPVAPPRPAGALNGGSNDNSGEPLDEAAHFRDVYQQYMSMRKDCGESVEGLSYEKFETTLTKTRDQVLSKHPAKAVRFTVYVKEGKAALKAAPVKR
jgi:hypothetical protein